MSIAVGIDQDTKRMAYAIVAPNLLPDVSPVTGTHLLPNWKSPLGRLEWGAIQEEIHKWVKSELVSRYGVTSVTTEALHFSRDPQVFCRLATVRAAVIHACYIHRLDWDETNALGWRKKFLGYGKARKGETTKDLKLASQAVCDARGWAYETEHEAEACGILNWRLCRDFPGYAELWLPIWNPHG